MLLPTESLNLVLADDEQPETKAVNYDEPQLARLRARDPQAFDQMVHDQSDEINRLVSRLLGWEMDCDDVVQEVFMTAWIKMDRFRAEASLKTWLFAIAINQCRKVRRKRGRWKRAFKRISEQQGPDQQPNEAGQGSFDEITNVNVASVHEALNQLKQCDREIIVLCCLESKTSNEAGKVLGIRKNTAEVRLHRARQRLKTLLRNQHQESNQEVEI